MGERESNCSGETLEQHSPTFAATTDNDGHTGDEYDSNNHFALLYETQEDQLSTMVPFIREGLNQNERCLYILAENTEANVVSALRNGGIDVDAARESGQLLFHNAEDSYLGSGSFDRDAVLDFWETSLLTAYDKGYAGIRVTGEMTWVFDSDIDPDSLVAYEEALNSRCSDEDYVLLCQYNRERFSSELLSKIIDHHPKLVYDDTVAENVYYIPPDEDIDQEHSNRYIDWQLQSLVERARAEKASERRERGLRSLTAATQTLMSVGSDSIGDRVADIARDVLRVEFTSYWPYNENSGELELHSSSTDLQADVPSLADLYEDRAWQTFITEQTDASNDLPSPSGIAASETPLRSGVIVTLGRHGVFCAGSTRPNEFDEMTVNLAKMLGTSIERALDRSHREQTLQTRNNQLDRLRRINSVIREISNVLVEADTRTAIEQKVCERLAKSDPYQFVWIGEQDVKTDTVTPRAQAGIQNGYLDSITVTTDETPTGRGPIGTAVRTRTVQVVQDLLTDPMFTPWREKALTHGFRSCISVPLMYEQSFYGVLSLYTDTPNAIDEMEQDVMGELGETIAHSIDAVETKETLQTDSVTELTLTVQGSNDVLSRIARDVGCQIHFDGLVPQTAGPAHFFFTTQNVDPNKILTRGSQLAGITEIQIIRNEDTDCVFEAIVTEPTLASHVVDQQAVIRSLTISEEKSTIVVDIPPTTDVRTFVERVCTAYPVDLVARHTRDRSITSQQDLHDTVDEQLTDRQREVLKTAYLSGFFESPRVRTGTELSDTLNISQSTFTHHLREAERRLCETVFENG
ncbi:MEDS domain-containing protein [Halocatena marina]|uniref:MEDS domain-containing protein n=1 Tax=Halocatena marina TaxID=2934937 RepID=UPI00200C33F9|nr:MEDS domain-containing protein [Halocatena marina]